MIPQFNTILDLVKAFPDDKTCHQYIAGLRWDGYMECPHAGCTGDRVYVFKDGIRYKCATCKKQYTALKGTVFEGSNLSLVKWFMAMYLFRHTKGITSVQLAKEIGCTQATAWYVLHRIRAACGNVKQEKIHDQAAVDVTYVGGKNKNRHWDKKIKGSQGRSHKDKTAVFGIMGGDGKIRAQIVKHESRREVQPIIYKNLTLGATLVSDEFNVYRAFETNYRHVVINHSRGQYANDGYSTNSVEGFWSHLKRKIIGLHHQVSRKYLNFYLQETVFKYNNRHLSPRELFDRIITQSVCQITLKSLTLN